MIISITIPGAPRTKKTSQRIVRFGKNREHIRVLPSEEYEAWFARTLLYKGRIRRELREAPLPLSGPIHVQAVFYRERAAGDLTGFMQAIADALQVEKFRRNKKGQLVKVRDGLGIIQDDSQIVNWDGTRAEKDPERPRIEVTIAPLGAEQEGLFAPSNELEKEEVGPRT